MKLYSVTVLSLRYEDIEKQAKSGHATKQQLDSKWFEFVSTNLPFYSTLFIGKYKCGTKRYSEVD